MSQKRLVWIACKDPCSAFATRRSSLVLFIGVTLLCFHRFKMTDVRNLRCCSLLEIAWVPQSEAATCHFAVHEQVHVCRVMPDTSPLTGHMAPLDAITAVDLCPVSSSADWRSCLMSSHLQGNPDLSLPSSNMHRLSQTTRGLESEPALPSPLQVRPELPFPDSADSLLHIHLLWHRQLVFAHALSGILAIRNRGITSLVRVMCDLSRS